MRLFLNDFNCGKYREIQFLFFRNWRHLKITKIRNVIVLKSLVRFDNEILHIKMASFKRLKCVFFLWYMLWFSFYLFPNGVTTGRCHMTALSATRLIAIANRMHFLYSVYAVSTPWKQHIWIHERLSRVIIGLDSGLNIEGLLIEYINRA